MMNTAPSWSAAHRNDYTEGQRVQVFNDSGRPWYVGTISHYWRNGCFIIREDDFGTTCAHNVSALAPAE